MTHSPSYFCGRFQIYLRVHSDGNEIMYAQQSLPLYP